jgi:hypothetical protein
VKNAGAALVARRVVAAAIHGIPISMFQIAQVFHERT